MKKKIILIALICCVESVLARPDNKESSFLFKIPSWPFATIFYANHDLLQTDYSFLWANNAWSSAGRTQGVAQLVFGEGEMRVQDTLIASKLLAEELVNAPAALVSQSQPGTFQAASENHYLAILANQPLLFDASMEQHRVDLNYARHYRQAELSFGVQIPLVTRRNKIKLKSKLSPATIQQLTTTDALAISNFFQSYASLEDFIVDSFNKKNIRFSKEDSEFGLGDIAAFLNFEIKTKHAERCMVGFQVTLPSSRPCNVYKLWEPELGDEGFTSISTFGSALFACEQYINPHVFLQASISPSSRVDRRVPELKSYNGVFPDVTGTKVPDYFAVFGDQIAFMTPFSNIPDTTFRQVATKSTRVKLRKGPELTLQVGNIMEHVLLKQGYLDLFYNFRARGKTYHGFHDPFSSFDTDVLTHNTYQVHHKIGGRYTYLFDKNWRFHSEVLYTFAGRNVIIGYQLGASLSADF